MQFSLRSLFVAMTALAIACGFAGFVPVEISQLLIGFVWIVATSLLIVGLFFGRGDRRAFCIGASVVVSSMWTGIGGRFMQGIHYLFGIFSLGYGVSQPILLWLDLAVLAALAVANGWLCMRARAYFERD
ncbi:MAG: hypothetical protein SH868_08515 [Bythopirellula sp.]|nr:hypothetical protein [Bythopirellula sp.]